MEQERRENWSLGSLNQERAGERSVGMQRHPRRRDRKSGFCPFDVLLWAFVAKAPVPRGVRLQHLALVNFPGATHGLSGSCATHLPPSEIRLRPKFLSDRNPSVPIVQSQHDASAVHRSLGQPAAGRVCFYFRLIRFSDRMHLTEGNTVLNLPDLHMHAI